MDKDAMITYLMGETQKRKSRITWFDYPRRTRRKAKASLERSLIHVNQWQHQHQFLTIQDLYLQVRKGERGICTTQFTPAYPTRWLNLLLKGDITRLEVDAIVNAANKTLLGCMKPLHDCVDNAIHTYAGVQLRQACFELILERGYEEPVGMAKQPQLTIFLLLCFTQ